MTKQAETRIFHALSQDAINRIRQLSIWLWADHGEHAVSTAEGIKLPTAAGTSEHSALLSFIAALPEPAMAELFALAYVGSAQHGQERAMEVYCSIRDMHMDTQQMSAKAEAEAVLAHMPLAAHLDNGLTRLALASAMSHTVH